MGRLPKSTFGRSGSGGFRVMLISKRKYYRNFYLLMIVAGLLIFISGSVANKYLFNIDMIDKINSLNLTFLGFDMSWIAQVEGGLTIIIPLIAGLSAFIMCVAQNKMNVLQVEQSNYNKWGMVVFSVCLSLYLGYFVPAGIALYWTFSNLFAVLQQFILNIMINPKKYVYLNKEKLSKAFLYVLLLSVIIGLVQGVMGAVLISGIEKTTKMILEED